MAKAKEGAKRGPKRTEPQREADFVLVAEGMKTGKDFMEIAREISSARNYSLTYWQIKKDAETIIERWREAYIWEIESMKMVELATINRIEAQAWAAWDRSKENYQHATKTVDSFKPKARKKKDTIGLVSREKVIQRTGGRLPNNQYLQTICWCVEMRSKLFSLIPKEMLEGFGGNGQGQPVGITMVFKTNKSADQLMNYPVKVLTDQEVKEKKTRPTDLVDDSPDEEE